ncbi:hypothetical protein GBAR_LOCUS8091 [Geodia barretti]|uniref:Uncharacterized protein n=1 Tax=Geodia barretti TaxID=519541 RepID=A0AA35RKA7_GEOBA|nr:hypothetical protein GBAR_LOCUS8091 [Geodia barretti]
MRIIDNLMALSADKGHSPFPSSERAVCGFALWLVSFLALDPCPQFPSSSPSQPHSIPPLRDLDISQVNRVLYHRHHSSDPQTPTHPLSHGRSF